MNSKRAKKILAQARKNSRTGKVATRKEYDRLKKLHKTHTQIPKQKITHRQQRRKGMVVYGLAEDLSPKPKAHKWRQGIIKTKK